MDHDEDPIYQCQPPNKKRRVQCMDKALDNTLTVSTSSLMNNVKDSSSFQKIIIPIGRSCLVKDANNNRNKAKENCNSSSKSYMENPQKGKSIKRKSYNTQHVSFEGSQAPQALSVQITSPRQLHTAAALSHWRQPTGSPNDFQHDSNRVVNDSDGRLNDSMFERDFQQLRDVQRLYPNCQLQSTPRVDATVTLLENNDYNLRLTPKSLFE